MSGGAQVRLIYFLPVLVVALFAGIAATALFTGEDRNKVPSALVGKQVLPFRLAPLAGMGPGFEANDLRGQITIVNFFASWCTPCLAEHPIFMQLAKRPEIRLFGINYKDKPADAAAWLRRHGNPYRRIGVDPAGQVAIDWGLSGVPETYVVDRAGRIRFQHIGPLTPAIVRDKLLPILQQIRTSETN